MYKLVVLLVVFYAAALTVPGQDPAPSPTPAGDPPKIKDLTASPSPAALPSPSAVKKTDDEIIKVSTDLVTTPVSVLDRQGRFIPGLKKKDFQIFDNGLMQQITYFQSEEQPFTVVLMIDISPSTKYKIDEIRFAALTFVNQLRPTDKVMVIAFDQRIRLLTEQPTADRATIVAAIYRTAFGSGTSLYEAVRFVTELDLIKITGRKAVVIFTDGVDTTSRAASYETTVAGVQEVDALFYPIRYNTMDDAAAVTRGPTGGPAALPPDIQAMLAARGITIDPRAVRTSSGTSTAQYLRGQQYLTKLAENTGGRIFEATDIKNLEDAFKNVAEELRRQYSIGYYPQADGTPGERRSLKIKVTRPGVLVRSKSGYIIRQPRADGGT